MPRPRINPPQWVWQRLGSDETSTKDNGKKHWIWCVTAAKITVFRIATTRSREALEKQVGKESEGYLNFNYFPAKCSLARSHWFAVIDYAAGDKEEIAKYDLSEDYCRLMFADEVEPTNNHGRWSTLSRTNVDDDCNVQ